MRWLIITLFLSVSGCLTELPDPPEESGVPDGQVTSDRQLSDARVFTPADGQVPDARLRSTDVASLDMQLPPTPDVAPPTPDMAPPTPDMAPPAPDMAPPAPDMAPPAPDMAPPEPDMAPPPDEVCNGEDDDMDGHVDEDTWCGNEIVEHCGLVFGWTTRNQRMPTNMPNWNVCDADDRLTDAFAQCNHNPNQRFNVLKTWGRLGGGEYLHLQLICDNSLIGAWTQTHCRASLGQRDGNVGRRLDRLNCNGSNAWSCLSTEGDGRFHSLQIRDNTDDDTRFAVAWTCEDRDDQARAAVMTESVAVFFGWAYGWEVDLEMAIPSFNPATFARCPADELDQGGHERCVSSAGDGQVHTLRVQKVDDPEEWLGIALLPLVPE